MLQEHPEIRAEHHNLEQLKTADRLESRMAAKQSLTYVHIHLKNSSLTTPGMGHMSQR